MAKKITQYPASGGNPESGSLFDISELNSGLYTTKKITLSQLLTYFNANLTFNTGVKQFINGTANTISNGTLVSIVNSDSLYATVTSSLDADQINGQLYVANENVSGDAIGNFISDGVINNVNTNAFNVGDKLYWNFITNTYTTSIATNGATIFYGVVLVKSASVGSIYVSPTYDFKSNISGDSSQVALFQHRDKITGNTKFTFVDNVGTEVGYRIQDGLNNLTQVGVTYINIESETAQSVLRLSTYNDNEDGSIVAFRKSRGSKSFPDKVLTNDVIGTIIFTGQAEKTIVDQYGEFVIVPSGMTTAEFIVRAKENYERFYDNFESATTTSGLTQYEIWLQPSSGSIAGDFVPLNIKVFSVDGDGKVNFKNYNFPILDGATGTSLITDGAGNIAWGTPSASSATSMQTIGRNSTGSILRKGTIVYISGSTGNRPNFVKAQANSEATSAGTFGVVVSDIANNSDGYVVTIGTLSNLDTRSVATNPFTTDTLVDGDTLYLSPTTAGYVTNVKPSAPNHLVYIGKVVLTSPTNGTIVYRIQNGYELEELHNVAIPTTPTNGQVLTYESSTNLWKPQTPSSSSQSLPFKEIAFGSSSNSITSASTFKYYNGILTVNSSNTQTSVEIISTTDSATTYPKLILYRFKVSGGYVITGDVTGSFALNTNNVHSIDIIKSIATENHGYTTAGSDVILYSIPNGGVVNQEVVRLKQDGKLRIGNVYDLPKVDGTNGQVLVTDGAGSVSWGVGNNASTFIPNLLGYETFRGVNYSNNSTTDVVSGGVTLSMPTGSAQIARSVSSTNYVSKIIRKGYYGSTVSAGRYTAVRGTALLWYMGGGFKYICDFHISDTAYGAGCRQFYGMAGQITDLGYSDSILVSSLLNIIGVGSDSADANLQIFYNDGAGTASKIDLGSNFPSNRTSGAAMTTMYSVVIYNAPNSSSVKVQVTNKETGSVSQNTLTTDLPLGTQGLNFYASRTMGVGITNTGQFDLAILGVYSI